MFYFRYCSPNKTDFLDIQSASKETFATRCPYFLSEVLTHQAGQTTTDMEKMDVD